MTNNERKSILVRAPRDIMNKLRIDFPKMVDQDLIRMAYNTSLIRIKDLGQVVKMEASIRNAKK